jgi:hypothetical protein
MTTMTTNTVYHDTQRPFGKHHYAIGRLSNILSKTQNIGQILMIHYPKQKPGGHISGSKRHVWVSIDPLPQPCAGISSCLKQNGRTATLAQFGANEILHSLPYHIYERVEQSEDLWDHTDTNSHASPESPTALHSSPLPTPFEKHKKCDCIFRMHNRSQRLDCSRFFVHPSSQRKLHYHNVVRI